MGRRLADSLHADLIAVNLETPQFLLRSPEERVYATQALNLAESLGAEVVVRPAQDMVAELINIAKEKNATSVVVGKPVRPRWRKLIGHSLVDDLVRRSGKITVHVVSSRPGEARLRAKARSSSTFLTWRTIIPATFAVSAATGICFAMYPFFELANLIMVYLLVVAWVSSRYAMREAVLATVLSVAAFDFCFVPPRYTFAVTDVQYLVTFLVMLVISLLISSTGSGFRGARNEANGFASVRDKAAYCPVAH